LSAAPQLLTSDLVGEPDTSTTISPRDLFRWVDYTSLRDNPHRVVLVLRQHSRLPGF
ncbi:hypothetical protein FRC09_015585, partial [Ceratobasidium sp. 395]